MGGSAFGLIIKRFIRVWILETVNENDVPTASLSRSVIVGEVLKIHGGKPHTHTNEESGEDPNEFGGTPFRGSP